jgi:hypothetical protein
VVTYFFNDFEMVPVAPIITGIIIIIVFITIIQGIILVPATNHVSRENSVAAVLCLQFVLHVMLFRP